MKLFRQEVHAAQAAQWLGSVRLHRPLSYTLVTGAALAMALALIAFAAWGEVNRKARLSGLLVPLSDVDKSAELQAHLFAPSRTAGFVRPGQTVYLRYAAYPYQKFGLYTGHITAVSATPFAPSELPANLAQQLITQAGSNEALYRINVQLDEQSINAYGNTLQLKAGLTLDADVLQERRKVWEWVLEPVLAARQQVKVLNADPNKAREGG